MNRDRDFERWVRERLSSWPTPQILAFERWLLDEEHFEFVPAVREAWHTAEIERLRAQLAEAVNASAA